MCRSIRRALPTVAGFLAVSAFAGLAAAQETDSQLQTAGANDSDPLEDFGSTQRGPKPDAAPVAEAPASALHFKIAVDYTSAYYFRGIRQEDRGFIVQPAGELGFDLYESEGFSIGGFAGLWNSFHDRATGSAENEDIVDKWYEADLYLGLGGSVGNLGYSVSYIAYTSPNDAFETVDEVLLALTYDDSAWWGESGFTLTPSLAFAIEVGDDYADGAGTERGLYLQPGLTPAFTLTDVPLVGEIALSFPLVVGFSLDDYYEDATGDDQPFGFFSASAKASVPLPMPAEYGNWTLTGSVQWLILGDTTSEINDDDETEIIGGVGVTVTF